MWLHTAGSLWPDILMVFFLQLLRVRAYGLGMQSPVK